MVNGVVHHQRRKLDSLDSGITEPHIVKSKGNIEQYPNWDVNGNKCHKTPI